MVGIFSWTSWLLLEALNPLGEADHAARHPTPADTSRRLTRREPAQGLWERFKPTKAES